MAPKPKFNLPLTLFAGKPDNGQYNWSIFVTKLESRLRFSGLKYTVEAGSMSEAPKNKIPYVRVIPQGTGAEDDGSLAPYLVGDSSLIVKHLVELGGLQDLNGDLDSVQAAQDLAFRSLLEDKLYFFMVRERWTTVPNFYITRDIGPLSTIPWPIRLIVGSIVYNKLVRTLHGQGAGRYSDAEMETLNEEGWEAIASLVTASHINVKSRKKVRAGGVFWAMGGEAPTELDSTLFGFIAATLICEANPRIQRAIRRHPVLLEYAGNIHEAYFPDYEKWED